MNTERAEYIGIGNRLQEKLKQDGNRFDILSNPPMDSMIFEGERRREVNFSLIIL